MMESTSLIEWIMYAILDAWYEYRFELFWLACGLSFMAVMDFFAFQRIPDSGYWSLHTFGSKRDAWHDAKKLAILCFGIAAIGDTKLIVFINNPFFQLALAAFFLQFIIYKVIFKGIISRIIKRRK